jgi:hypothetical protein
MTMKKKIRNGGVVALALLLAVAATAVVRDASAQGPVTLKVYNPTGAFQVTQTFAPRLPDLNGKTICEVTNGSWEADRMFPAIRQLLQRQYPTAKIVTFEELPKLSTGIDVPGLEEAVKKYGCQGAIIGNAG